MAQLSPSRLADSSWTWWVLLLPLQHRTSTHPLPMESARAPGYLQCHCSLLCGACIGFCCPLQRTCHSRQRLPPGRPSYQLAARSGPGLLSCGCYLVLWGETDCVLSLAPAALAMGGKHAMEKGLVIHIVLRSTRAGFKQTLPGSNCPLVRRVTPGLSPQTILVPTS